MLISGTICILVPGALAYFVFDSFIIGFSVAVALSIAALFIGDLIAPRWQKILWTRGNDLYHDDSYRLDSTVRTGSK